MKTTHLILSSFLEGSVVVIVVVLFHFGFQREAFLQVHECGSISWGNKQVSRLLLELLPPSFNLAVQDQATLRQFPPVT